MLLSEYDGLGQSLPAQGGPHLPGNRESCYPRSPYGDDTACKRVQLFGLDGVGLPVTKGGPLLPGSEGSAFTANQRMFGLSGLGQEIPELGLPTFEAAAMIAAMGGGAAWLLSTGTAQKTGATVAGAGLAALAAINALKLFKVV